MPVRRQHDTDSHADSHTDSHTDSRADSRAGRQLQFDVEPALAAHLRPGLVTVHELTVRPAGEPVERACRELEERLRESYGRLSQPGEIPRVQAVRHMFHALHIDPTKVRPSSEALLRRVLKGKELYRISNAVDICNLCSLETLIPMGLYDLATIRGGVRLMLGGRDAGYDGIRKDRVHVEGRPALVDAEGPFGAPTSDSFRTRVRESTRDLLLVVFAPAGLDASEVEAIIDTVRVRYVALAGGRIGEARLPAGGAAGDAG